MIRLLRRVCLTAQMTGMYQGRFDRRDVWRFYWREAGRMVRHG